jgi:hypothetical protein
LFHQRVPKSQQSLPNNIFALEQRGLCDN